MKNNKQMECKHEEWIKLCVICGEVLDDSSEETRQVKYKISSTDSVTYYEYFDLTENPEI